MDLTRSNLLEAYRVMTLIRAFEERLHVEFATGEIPGFVHLYAGEEAIATGFCLLLDQRDKIASTHRGHGHCLAKGCDVDGMMAEIYGKKSGLCAGKGGSMHIADLSKGMLGANGIVGGGPPLACGAALAAKRLGTGGVAVSVCRRRRRESGNVPRKPQSGVDLEAALHLRHREQWIRRGYVSKYSGRCHDFADRANGFNMPGVTVDGHDFFAVYEIASEAVRAGSGRGGTDAGRVQGQAGTTATSRAMHKPIARSNEVEKIREATRLLQAASRIRSLRRDC